MEMVITTKVTYQYLMNKSKHNLAHMVLDLLDKQEKQADGLTICQNCGSWLRAGECENCNSPLAPASPHA